MRHLITALLATILVLSNSSAAQEIGQQLELRIRDATNAPVVGAVVYLTGDTISETTQPERVSIDQRDNAFVPSVAAVQVDGAVDFVNSDDISHHVYSFSQPNSFELPLYARDKTPSQIFNHAGVVTLGCNIHDTMLGYIVVVDSPYFGSTSDDGSVTFQNLPPGRYEAKLFSPYIDSSRAILAGAFVVTPDVSEATRTMRLERRVKLPRDSRRSSSLSWNDY